MLNFNRRDRAPEPTPGKFALKPQDAGGTATATAALNTNPGLRTPPGSAAPLREAAAAPAARETPAPQPSASPNAAAAAPGPASATAAAASKSAPTPGSKLSIGINIKLKGVEITDCDVLSIEGHVDATVRSTMMEIAEPGTLNGVALIDVAEVHGSFTGELMARTRLVIHGTGRVSGKIRYGKLVVEEGGELSGDVQRIEDVATARDKMPAQPASVATAR